MYARWVGALKQAGQESAITGSAALGEDALPDVESATEISG